MPISEILIEINLGDKIKLALVLDSFLSSNLQLETFVTSTRSLKCAAHPKHSCPGLPVVYRVPNFVVGLVYLLGLFNMHNIALLSCN